MISPNPNVRKSQYLAFQNSSGVDKNYKMDLHRFSPLKSGQSEFSDISPIRDIPRPIKTEEPVFADTSEFYPNIIISPEGTGEFVLNNE